MWKIGLMAAMSQESRALLKRLKNWERTPIGHLPGYTFSIAACSCTLVTSGMGRRRANEAARLLVEKARPEWMISFGIAGAVEADLEIGDIILADASYTWDGSSLSGYTPLARWPHAAVESATQAIGLLGSRVLAGSAITSSGSQPGQGQLGSIAHPMLEMETAGIAQVASQSNLPLLSLRAISDGPRAPIPLDLASVMDEDANLDTGKLFKELLRKPGIILQGSRMLHNSAIAADHAAQALIAALNHWPD